MIEKLREMEKARQEMKRQAFLVELEGRGFNFTDKSRDEFGFNDETLNMVWEMWQAAQEQMLRETTWNDYSIISPAIEGRYQIFINGEQLAADWIDKFGFADPFDGDALRQDLITHWQPLPQPPKQ